MPRRSLRRRATPPWFFFAIRAFFCGGPPSFPLLHLCERVSVAFQPSVFSSLVPVVHSAFFILHSCNGWVPAPVPGRAYVNACHHGVVPGCRVERRECLVRRWSRPSGYCPLSRALNLCQSVNPWFPGNSGFSRSVFLPPSNNSLILPLIHSPTSQHPWSPVNFACHGPLRQINELFI